MLPPEGHHQGARPSCAIHPFDRHVPSIYPSLTQRQSQQRVLQVEGEELVQRDHTITIDVERRNDAVNDVLEVVAHKLDLAGFGRCLSEWGGGEFFYLENFSLAVCM